MDPVQGFMEGYSEEEARKEASRCMHCDCRKSDSCKLRRYADDYNADRKRFAPPERKSLLRNLQHNLVVYEPEKCIRCGLCIEITQKGAEQIGLAFAGRGFDVRVKAPFHSSMEEALKKTAAACAAACPTGALALKEVESVIW
jgi:NADH dehydrogenase/NADH:ubiquinone oxidoreductase subunit G